MLHPLTGEDVDIVVTRNGKEKSFKIDPNYKTYLSDFHMEQMKKRQPRFLLSQRANLLKRQALRLGI